MISSQPYTQYARYREKHKGIVQRGLQNECANAKTLLFWITPSLPSLCKVMQ